MKRIRHHKKFKKNFSARIAPNKRLSAQFETRFSLFLKGVREAPLNDHALGGRHTGLRAFSISGDIRVIYQETEKYYRFIDIGSHNQVY